jgi:tetratricopeptide (TPR) repeat protein
MADSSDKPKIERPKSVLAPTRTGASKAPPPKPSAPRADSTMDVPLDEVVEVPKAPKAPVLPPTESLTAMLTDLEGEVGRSPTRREPSVPPPPPTSTEKRSVPPPMPARAPSVRPPKPPSMVAGPRAAPPPRAPAPPSAARRAPPPAGARPPSSAPSTPGIIPAVAVAPRAPQPPRVIEVGVEAWERELLELTDPLRRARLHFEIARQHELGGDFRKAAHHYQEALAKMPEHVPSIQGARRALLAQKSYKEALPLFDAEARVTRDPKGRAAIHVAKGRVLEDLLGQKVEARAQYAVALDLDRSDRSALRALEQADLDAGAYVELARTYEKAANAASGDPHHRAALVAMRARIAEIRQKDVDAAIELHQTALRLDPDVAFSLEALERLLHGQKRWRDLAALLERKVTRATDPMVRAMALQRIAHLSADRLGNRDEAIAALERAAIEAPTEPLVLEDLARLYDAGGRAEPLTRVLATLASLPSASRFDRISMLHRIGTLREDRLADPDGAISAYEQVLAIDPVHLPTLQALTRLYESRGDHDSLLRISTAESEQSPDMRRRAAAHARIADLLEHTQQQPDAAIEHHARALTLVAGYPPSFKALTRLYATQHKWRELALLYGRAVDGATGESAITYLMKLGAVYEDALDEPAQALAAYQRVLAMDPKHLGAIHAAQRAAERAGRATELVDALEREASLSRDPKATIGIVHRAGEVLDEMAGDRDGAIARYRRVLAIEPTYAPALTSLGRLLARAGRWEELLDLYKRELDLAKDAESIVGLRLKMAEISEERTGRDDEALGHYRAAVEADPKNVRALRSLARKLRDRSAWEELVRTLDRELATHDAKAGTKTDAPSGVARARAAHRVAEVREERLNDATKALTLYEQARDADPTYRPAIDAIARLRAEGGAHKKLLDELEHDAKSATDDATAIALLLRASEVASEHANDPKRALALAEEALARDPGHLASLLAVEPLLRRAGSFEALASVLASLSRVHAEPEARIAALRDLARIQETKLANKPQEIAATHEAILALAPDDAIALSALERIALEIGDRTLLASVDARLATRSQDPIIAAAHRGRLAEALLESGDPRALEAFSAAVAADPESLAAVRGLGRAAEASGDARAVADALRREARIVESPRRGASLLVRAGVLTADVLVDAAAAYVDFERALELDPENVDAPSHVLEILLARGEAGRAADRLGRAALAARTPERVAALSLEVARLQAEVLSDAAGGIATLVRALKTSPSDVTLLRAVARLYGAAGQWPEAAEKLRAIVALAPSKELLAEAQLELAAIEIDRLGDVPRAQASVAAVLAAEPESGAALAVLARIERKAGRPNAAIDALKRLATASAARVEQAKAYVDIANIERDRGDEVRALDALAEAVAIEGPDGDAGAAFRGSLRSGDTNGWSRYGQAVYDHVRRAKGDPRRTPPASVYIGLADVLSDTLGRHESALEVLREAMRAHEGNAQLARRFARGTLRAGRPVEGLETLRRLADTQPGNVELARELSAQLAAIAPDTRALTVGPLLLLGAATAEEEQRARSRPPPLPRIAAGSFGSETLALLYRVDFSSPAFAMLAALPEAIVKLYPADLDGLGVGRGDRLAPRSGHPLRVLADRIATLLSAGDVELYTHRVRGRGVAIELSEPVSVLLPSVLGELPEASQIFLIGRAMANAALGLSIFDKLTPRELEVTLAAAARVVSPQFGQGLTSEDVLDDQSRRIQRALSRRARRALEEIAPRYVAAGSGDLPGIARSVSFGAARTAALLADDLSASVEALRRTERDYGNATVSELVSGAPLVSDLVRFWTSDIALDVRRRAGLLP